MKRLAPTLPDGNASKFCTNHSVMYLFTTVRHTKARVRSRHAGTMPPNDAHAQATGRCPHQCVCGGGGGARGYTLRDTRAWTSPPYGNKRQPQRNPRIQTRTTTRVSQIHQAIAMHVRIKKQPAARADVAHFALYIANKHNNLINVVCTTKKAPTHATRHANARR